MTVRASIVGRTAELSAVELLHPRPSPMAQPPWCSKGRGHRQDDHLEPGHRSGRAPTARRHLSCRCTEADAGWAFSGLGDLFDGLAPTSRQDTARRPAAGTRRAPPGRRRACRPTPRASASSRSPSSASSGRSAGPARCWSRSTTSNGWIADSRQVLSFALRRLRDERGATPDLLSDRPLPDATAADAELGLAGERLSGRSRPASVLCSASCTSASANASPGPTLTRLRPATDGNPMMFLEMSRALQRRGGELSGRRAAARASRPAVCWSQSGCST